MSKIIGIDLGTTNSVVAIMEGDAPVVVVNDEGARTTPSVIAINKDNDRLVGAPARRQALTNPKNTIYSAKRFMGMRWDEISKEAQRVPYDVTKGDSGDCRIKAKGKLYSAPEISAMVLQKLKRQAEKYLGSEVTEAVITVPAYFNDSQRQATKDAGTIAGLQVRRIINEPTAAAMAYGLDQNEDQVIAVYDFGGGTFDISILEVDGSVIEVKSTNGDTHLGGDDVDQALIDWLMEECQKEHGVNVSGEAMVLQRLKEAAEKAKIELSSSPSTTINLPWLTADAEGPKHLERTLSRAQFERMIEPIIERTMEPCRLALKDARVQASQIDEVVLVGGSTRIPLVQKKVKELFGKEPNRSVNPDEVVALGAAIQGGVLSGDVTDVLLLDVTPLSLGIETLGGVFTALIDRNTTIPTKKSEVFSTAADNQTAVDIHVFQGERSIARDNRKLANFRLEGLLPAPRGMPQIEVTFDINADGILNVTAKDNGTGKEQRIVVQNSSGLSNDEIERMVDEAEANEDADAKAKEKIEARNTLDSIIHQVDKMVEEHGEKLDPEAMGKVEEALREAREAATSDDLVTLQEATQNLTSASHQLAQVVYQQAGAGDPGMPADGAEPEQSSGPDDVIDVEYKES